MASPTLAFLGLPFGGAGNYSGKEEAPVDDSFVPVLHAKQMRRRALTFFCLAVLLLV